MLKRKPRSEETKRKISEALKGNINSKDRKLTKLHKFRIGRTNKVSIKKAYGSGKIMGFQKGHKIWLGKHHSKTTKEKLSKMKRGSKGCNWKGGKKREHYTDWRYNKWRNKVFERDDYTCQDCGQRGGELQAHHKKSWVKYPKLRYIVSNGKTLCKKCHKKYRKKKRR